MVHINPNLFGVGGWRRRKGNGEINAYAVRPRGPGLKPRTYHMVFKARVSSSDASAITMFEIPSSPVLTLAGLHLINIPICHDCQWCERKYLLAVSAATLMSWTRFNAYLVLTTRWWKRCWRKGGWSKNAPMGAGARTWDILRAKQESDATWCFIWHVSFSVVGDWIGWLHNTSYTKCGVLWR